MASPESATISPAKHPKPVPQQQKPPEALEEFGKDTPLGRPGQPCEVAPSYVFPASELDSSYFTGQVLHPNGGSVMMS